MFYNLFNFLYSRATYACLMTLCHYVTSFEMEIMRKISVRTNRSV